MVAIRGESFLVHEEYQLIGMEAATSAGTARAEAPGLSEAREKAGAVPAKRVRRNGNQRHRKKESPKMKYRFWTLSLMPRGVFQWPRYDLG